LGALPAIVAGDAHRWMVEAVSERDFVRIAFANGDRFRFPLAGLGCREKLQVNRAAIAPDGRSIEIPAAGRGGPVELPWDLVRAECAPVLADQARAVQAATARAGIARATVNRIERGRLLPELSTLRRIARALGMRLVDLIAW
jgi:DNA-binding XRE family transcriptional regulator